MATQANVHSLARRKLALVRSGPVDRRQDSDLDTEPRHRDGKMAPRKEPIGIGQVQRGCRIPSHDGGRGAFLKQMCSVQRRAFGAK